LRKRVEAQTEEKLEALKRRALFSAYKKAPQGSGAKEGALREYLDRAEILDAFQGDSKS
jgi:hypothetical protein